MVLGVGVLLVVVLVEYVGGVVVQVNELIVVFDSLCELLVCWCSGQIIIGGEMVEVVMFEELQIVLLVLQQYLFQVIDKVICELCSVQLLCEELFVQFNYGKLVGVLCIGLSVEQGDMVELVVMLFDQFLWQLQQGEEIYVLLGGLQLLVLCMVVIDCNFFEQKEYLVCQLFGIVIEVVYEWLDDFGSEVDCSLCVKFEQLVECVSCELFSVGLYIVLLVDIQQYFLLFLCKVQIVECCYIEVMQGCECFDQVCQCVSVLISECFVQNLLCGLLCVLFDCAWLDVLVLIILCYGEDSEVFISQLLIIDQLLGCKLVIDCIWLQVEVEIGLQQIGMYYEEVVQVVQWLVNFGESVMLMVSGEVFSIIDLVMCFKQYQCLGEYQQVVVELFVVVVVFVVLGKVGVVIWFGLVCLLIKLLLCSQLVFDLCEVELQEQLCLMLFGCWFEFIDLKMGKVVQCKFVWFLLVFGQILFVNWCGVCVEDMMLL